MKLTEWKVLKDKNDELENYNAENYTYEPKTVPNHIAEFKKITSIYPRTNKSFLVEQAPDVGNSDINGPNKLLEVKLIQTKVIKSEKRKTIEMVDSRAP